MMDTMSAVNIRVSRTILITVAVLLFAIYSYTDGAEYCASETFSAACDNADEVVVMRSALFGRMKLGRCVRGNYGHLGCMRNILSYMDRQCSGRRSCEVRVANIATEIGQGSVCPNDVRPYLDANYVCVKVVTPVHKQCGDSSNSRVTAKRGYLASVVTAETGVGSLQCPWVLEASPGQQIQLTLLDFGTSRKMNQMSCLVYGVLKEAGNRRSTTLCASNQRKRLVYVSKSHSIKAFLNIESAASFLIELKVIGCPDLKKSACVSVDRREDTSVVLCEATGESRILRCVDDTWSDSSGISFNSSWYSGCCSQ